MFQYTHKIIKSKDGKVETEFKDTNTYTELLEYRKYLIKNGYNITAINTSDNKPMIYQRPISFMHLLLNFDPDPFDL